MEAGTEASEEGGDRGVQAETWVGRADRGVDPGGWGPLRTNIQWKGTDVCIDFDCPCGAHGHFDGYFAYSIRCKGCGKVYELGYRVRTIETTDPHLVEMAVESDTT